MTNFLQKGKNMNRKLSSKSSIVLGFCVYKHYSIPLKKLVQASLKNFQLP